VQAAIECKNFELKQAQGAIFHVNRGICARGFLRFTPTHSGRCRIPAILRFNWRSSEVLAKFKFAPATNQVSAQILSTF
jgi:hypothetical protein